jgi:hypothetical protein
LNSRNHGYIYGIHNITKFVPNFILHKAFDLINHSNKCSKWILWIGPTHNACHFPFQSDCLLNFNFLHTYNQHFEKKSFVTQKLSNVWHGSQTLFKVCGFTCEKVTTNCIKVSNNVKKNWNIFVFFSTMKLHCTQL